MRLTLFLFTSALFAAAPLRACSVPVFRYALEHWPADPYEAVVVHRGPLSPAQEAAVRDLGADGLAGRLHANVSARTVDLDREPAPDFSAAALPWLVVKVPRTVQSGATVWAGPLTEANVQRLLDSPARAEVVERLGAGQSAVWVLIESGDRARDSAATQLLEAQLAELSATLALPQLEASDIANGLVSVAQEDLRLEFSVMRLTRDDPAEQPFLQMLLGTERDLANAREPIAIPIFGRGRALYAFVGAGLQRETIGQAARFLIGKCSCQVKEQNPGADLLLAADWEALVKAHTVAAPDLPTLAELARSAPETVTFGGEGKGTIATEQQAEAMSARNVYLVIAIVGALLAAASLLGLLGRGR